jgi:hypothetical protein
MHPPAPTRPARRAVTRALGACVIAALAGCLSVPDGPTPMCKATSDCDTDHGEVCEQGTCWGNPPAGMFAAVISPPSTRHDEVPRELPRFALSPDGQLGELRLEPPVLLNGRVVAFCPQPSTDCDTTPIGATVTVSRASQFHGGPGFKTIVNVESGADSFSIPVPVTGAVDAPYTVTIAPDGARPVGANNPGPSPAEQVPPLRLQVSLAASIAVKTIELGGQGLPTISGNLSDVLGQGLGGYRVSALGRWDASEPATEVSTVAFTDATGNYTVTLSNALVGTVELVARPMVSTVPSMTSAVAPTLHLGNIDATRSSTGRNVITPVTLGNETTVTVVVSGVDLNGTVSKVPGAVVSASGALVDKLTSFTVADEQVTNDQGEATLHLLDGAGIAGSYRLSIAPPASSTLSATFDQKLTVLPAAMSEPVPVQLGARLALRGVVVDSSGAPLENVAITARPSLRFLWSLDAAPQAFVSALPVSTDVTTHGTGVFVVWVDAIVDQVWGQYDLMIEPPTTTQAPTYVAGNLDFPRSATLDSFSVGTLTLPDPAFVHGHITDSTGAPLEGAELKLYLADASTSLCSQVAHAPASCPIPAQLQGRSTSDPKGAVRLVLPRMPIQ